MTTIINANIWIPFRVDKMSSFVEETATDVLTRLLRRLPASHHRVQVHTGDDVVMLEGSLQELSVSLLRAIKDPRFGWLEVENRGKLVCDIGIPFQVLEGEGFWLVHDMTNGEETFCYAEDPLTGMENMVDNIGYAGLTVSIYSREGAGPKLVYRLPTAEEMEGAGQVVIHPYNVVLNWIWMRGPTDMAVSGNGNGTLEHYGFGSGAATYDTDMDELSDMLGGLTLKQYTVYVPWKKGTITLLASSDRIARYGIMMDAIGCIDQAHQRSLMQEMEKGTESEQTKMEETLWNRIPCGYDGNEEMMDRIDYVLKLSL